MPPSLPLAPVAPVAPVAPASMRLIVTASPSANVPLLAIGVIVAVCQLPLSVRDAVMRACTKTEGEPTFEMMTTVFAGSAASREAIETELASVSLKYNFVALAGVALSVLT